MSEVRILLIVSVVSKRQQQSCDTVEIVRHSGVVDMVEIVRHSGNRATQ